jgi:hypothetical protein
MGWLRNFADYPKTKQLYSKDEPQKSRKAKKEQHSPGKTRHFLSIKLRHQYFKSLLIKAPEQHIRGFVFCQTTLGSSLYF